MENQTISDDEAPATMERHFARDFPANSGSLTIIIRDAGHLADILAFGRKLEVEPQFWEVLSRLIRTSLGPATAQGDRLAREGVLELWPDGWSSKHDTPSLAFMQTYDGRRALVGGLIWDRHTRSWSTHT